jgi:hypothetical protein
LIARAHGDLARHAVEPVRVVIDQADAVVARGGQHRGNHAADLAGAEHHHG